MAVSLTRPVYRKTRNTYACARNRELVIGFEPKPFAGKQLSNVNLDEAGALEYERPGDHEYITVRIAGTRKVFRTSPDTLYKMCCRIEAEQTRAMKARERKAKKKLKNYNSR